MKYSSPTTDEERANNMKVIPDDKLSQAYINVSPVFNADGSRKKYRVEIQRNSLMEVDVEHATGGAFNNVYQSGYNYRRSFMTTLKVNHVLKDGNKALNPGGSDYSFQGDKLVIPTRNETTGEYEPVDIQQDADKKTKVSVSIDDKGTVTVHSTDSNGNTKDGVITKGTDLRIDSDDGNWVVARINDDDSISVAQFGTKGMFTATQTQSFTATAEANAATDKTISDTQVGQTHPDLTGTDEPDPFSIVNSPVDPGALEPTVHYTTIVMPHIDQDGVILVNDPKRTATDNAAALSDEGTSFTFIGTTQNYTDTITTGHDDGRPVTTFDYTIGTQTLAVNGSVYCR